MEGTEARNYCIEANKQMDQDFLHEIVQAVEGMQKVGFELSFLMERLGLMGFLKEWLLSF